MHSSGAMRREIAGACLFSRLSLLVIARSDSDEAIHALFAELWIASLALVMTEKRSSVSDGIERCDWMLRLRPLAKTFIDHEAARHRQFAQGAGDETLRRVGHVAKRGQFEISQQTVSIFKR